jgi:hypothetical protein
MSALEMLKSARSELDAVRQHSAAGARLFCAFIERVGIMLLNRESGGDELQSRGRLSLPASFLQDSECLGGWLDSLLLISP